METPVIKIKRGTLAQLESAKTSNELAVGEVYLITDENCIAVGIGTNSYKKFYNTSDMDTLLSGKSATSHNHNLADLTEKSYNSLADKPDLSDLHNHTNKSLLDTYTNTNADISDAISKEHTHTNKTDLDAYDPDNFATAGHTHDDRYYTETETDTLLSGKQATITGGASTITSSNLTASRAVVSDASGKVSVSAVTSTEIGYLDGVTSAIQTQLDGKSATTHNHSLADLTEKSYNSLTDKPTIPTITAGTSAPSGGSDGDIYLQYE